MFGNIDDGHGVAGGLGLLGCPFVPLAAHLVAVPPVISDKLKALVRDVLGDGSDEVTGGISFQLQGTIQNHEALAQIGILC